jgi:hypothetical protein
MHFRSLRVINEDYIKPDSGFPFHSHTDMEILTYIISGKLEHKDSLGNTSQIQHGEIQLMRAGTGITHSEYNPSQNEEVHLLQIWVIPATKGLPPLYQQRNFKVADHVGKLLLVASPDSQDNSFTIAQDAKIYAALIENNEINYQIENGRNIWIQVVHGNLTVNQHEITNGDGMAITNETGINITGNGEFIMFDLA